MDRRFIACLLATSLFAGCCRTKPKEAVSLSDDRALAAFAEKLQRQIDRATDPKSIHDAEANTLAISDCVAELERRQARLEERLARADASGSESERTSLRLERIRIDRQLELLDRLLLRYEQNAPPVAATD